jgi:hypothetical protein
VLDYVKMKDEDGLEPWPSMEELPFVNTIEAILSIRVALTSVALG